MIKQSNNGSSGSKTLSQQDKEMGFQLLLSPKASVNIHSPSVAHESSHLYPKLAGPNWTCYITGDVIRLGRRPEHKPSSTNNNNNNVKNAIDVDFCGNKQISRRHADIKFNAKKNYWELRVYGRSGVKVNHNLVTKHQHPVPLIAMAYLDICGNGFVFMLPDHTDGVPGKSDIKPKATTTPSTSETVPPPPTTSQPDTTIENGKNDQLVTIIVNVLKSLNKRICQLTTEQIFKATFKQCRKQSLDSSNCTMDMVLRALVFDSQFKVAKECLEMTAEQSDKVQWCWQQPPLPPPPSPSPPTKMATTVTSNASNSGSWPDLGYDLVDENASTTTGTPTPMESESWLSSSTTTATIPSAISSSQTTTTTIPPIQSPSINRSMGERTFSGLSNICDGSISSPVHADSVEAPESTLDRTPWKPLELFHVSTYSDDPKEMPGYSRGLSLLHMYSGILAIRQQSGMDSDRSTPLSTPCSLFPTTPDDDDDDYDDLDMVYTNGKRKRYSTSDHKDRTLWTRFRTTAFKYKD